MIVSLDEFISTLSVRPNDQGASPSEALWVRFSQEQTRSTVEYRTADSNTIAHVYLGEGEALVGIEIFT